MTNVKQAYKRISGCGLYILRKKQEMLNLIDNNSNNKFFCLH